MKLIVEATDISRGFKPLILPHHAPKTSFGTGAKSARQSGAGEDFFSYREYGFSDDTRAIDWRRSARSDDVLIREHERLLPHHVYIDCDISGAMQFNSRSGLPTKAYAAQRLLLASAQLLMQGESRVVSLRGESAPAKAGELRKHSLVELAHQISAEYADIIPARLPPMKPRSFILLASDFRQGAAEWKNLIARASEIGAVGACVQMLDPMEHEFPLYGRVRLDSAENDESLIVPSADAVRPIYLERLTREQSAMRALCEQYGWRWITLTTDMAPRAQLSEVLQAVTRP